MLIPESVSIEVKLQSCMVVGGNMGAPSALSVTGPNAVDITIKRLYSSQKLKTHLIIVGLMRE